MGMRWYVICSRISAFYGRYKVFLRRFYWFCAIAACILIFAIPIGLGIVNPHVRLYQFHGPPPPEMMQRFNLAVQQSRRHGGRLFDFTTMVEHISDSYPFTQMVERRYGINYIELFLAVNDDLYEVARYDITHGFFENFLRDRYLSQIGNFGGLRISTEPREMVRWITQPYFFGYYDFRFYDDRFYIPIQDDNVASELLGEGILYLRVNNFLPKGYEPVTRHPFLHFCMDSDRQYLTDLFNNLYDVDDLIIDIRGIGNGFGYYFIPLILAPHLQGPVVTNFYAFHTDGFFAHRVSDAYRAWYSLGETSTAYTLTQNFTYDIPENLTIGFPVSVVAQPQRNVEFEGRIWLLTDSDNFSGPNFAYLQKARDARFTIVYEENPDSIGWDTSFTTLPHSGFSLRFNPLYFTDTTGMPFEETGPVYDYRLNNWLGMMGVTLP